MTALVARGPILSVYKNRMSRTTSPAVIELFADAGLLGEAFREAAPLRLLGETDERGAILVGERDAAPDLYLNMTFSTLRNRICRASCLREEQATTKSVGVVLDGTGDVYERITYDAYGQARHRFAADCDGNGQYDNNDNSGFFTNGTTIDDTLAYHADFDVNCDGAINVVDIGILAGSSPVALPDGWIGEPDSTTGPDNSIGYAGYVFNHEREDYTVRFRNYNPELGRWMQRDPIGYTGGKNLYGYVGESPLVWIDSYGLEPQDTRTQAQKMKAVCASLKDAIEHDMSVGDFAKKYHPNWNRRNQGNWYQVHLTVDGSLLGLEDDEVDVDGDWMITILYGTTEMPIFSVYHISATSSYLFWKKVWMFWDDDPHKFFNTGEAQAIGLAERLKSGEVTLLDLYDALGCEKYTGKACPGSKKNKDEPENRLPPKPWI